MRKSLLFIINSLVGGGAERVMSTLLANAGGWTDRYDLHLALLDREPIAYPPPAFVTLHPFDCRGGMAASVVAVRSLLGRLDPDLAFSFLTRANVANAAAHLGSRRPFILSERVHTTSHLGGGLRALPAKALVRLAYPRADRVVAVSEGVRRDLVAHYGVAEARVRVIDNPVDLDGIAARAAEPPAIPLDPPYVLGAGRLVRNKNFQLLVRAFAASGLDGRLVILGEGPEREALVRLAAELGIADRVILPGFAENPFAVMRGARLFALSSNAEGFPNSLVEAMAVGLPVLATDCDAGPAQILAETARGPVRGLTLAAHGLLTPVDAVEPMAEGLRRLADPALAADYAARARRRAADFGIARATRRYFAVIEETLAERGAAAGRGKTGREPG